MDIQIQIGIGEAYDRLTILEIKLERIEEERKIKNISKEYDYLVSIMATIVPVSYTHLTLPTICSV